MRTGPDKEILSDINSPIIAQYIEEKIEQKLRILDCPINGEFDVLAKRSAMYLPPPSQ